MKLEQHLMKDSDARAVLREALVWCCDQLGASAYCACVPWEGSPRPRVIVDGELRGGVLEGLGELAMLAPGSGTSTPPPSEPAEPDSRKAPRSDRPGTREFEVAWRRLPALGSGPDRDALIIQLGSGGQVVGWLGFAWREAGPTKPVLAPLRDARAMLCLALRGAALQERVLAYAERVDIDGLTGLYSHRFFQEALDRDMARARRFKHALSLLLINVDRFKRYNDTYGPAAGDVALRGIANTVNGSLRKFDLAARYGGEEFAVLLPQTSVEDATRVADRIRRDVSAQEFDTGRSESPGRLTISVGVAGYPTHADTKALLVDLANAALQSAKDQGRNRVGSSVQGTGKVIRLGFCPPSYTSPYYHEILLGLREVGDDIGGAEVTTRSPRHESQSSQLPSIFDEFIAEGVDAVALCTPSPDGFQQIDRLTRSGIKVFAFNVPSAPSGSGIAATVTYRQEHAGQEAARYLARVLRRRGSVLIVEGSRDATSELRVRGFRGELAMHPRIRVVDTLVGGWMRDKAREAVAEAMRGRHDIDAVFAANDEMAMGVADAIGEMGREGEVFVMGLDGTRSVLRAIADGRVTATVNTNPREMGRVLMRTVLRGLGSSLAETFIVYPVIVVDAENVEAHL